MRKLLTEIPRIAFRLALAAIFLYFGIRGLRDPQVEIARWMPEIYQQMINAFVPVQYFVMAFSVVQIGVALLIAIGVYLRWTLLIVALMLIAIIIMLGVSETALRDTVILAAVVYYASREVYHRY